VEQYLLFALLGLGNGAIYATVAQGLVLMHRASGVINFAHGALAMYAIYTYIDLRDQGRLILPIPAVPDVGIGGNLPFLPAFAIAVTMTALLGALAYLLVFRRLEHAPVLAKIVATVGLLLMIVGHIRVQFPSQSASPLFVPQVLPQDPVSIAGVSVSEDRLWLTALALLIAAVLAAVYRYTSFGLATRAAASSSKGAVLVGRDPARLALGNWILASALAGAFGVLVAPLISIAPGSVVLLVVPALAAAMLAGFRSFWIAALAGLALGMVESELVNLQTNHPWLPGGLQTIAPLLVIIIVAFLRGHSTVRRDDLAQDRLPASPYPRNVTRNLTGVGVLGLVALAVTSGDVRLGLIVSLIATVVCLSMVLLTGYVGQVSLMQVTFTGLSGLLLSALASDAGVPFPLAPLIAALAAGALGLLVGVPALRVRGTSLAVVTLSAAVATEQLVFSNSTLTGGVEGNAVAAPTIAGLDFTILGDDYPRLAFGVFVMVTLGLAVLAVTNLRRSPSGLRMLAVRMNERAATSSGVNVAQTKLVAFTLAAVIAGIGGALFAYQQVRFSASSFGVLTSLTFLALAYVGGITSVTGAFIAGALIPGGLVLTLVNKVVDFGLYESLVAGVLVMLNAVLKPEGMAGISRRGQEPHRSIRAMSRGGAAAHLRQRLGEARR
jgi:ABC-type branched-subunit amino acid transport system permease subunit